MRETPVCTAADAIYKLAAGNLKYLNAENGSGDISRRIRMSTWAKGQSPYAIIVTCSDSRVIPENIFSAGIGELFVIRLAGNIIDDHQLGSIEYAAGHLGCRLVVVLGHTHCGAVDAAINHEPSGYIRYITDEIKKAIGDETDPYKASCLNVRHSVQEIEKSLCIHNIEEETGLRVKLIEGFSCLSKYRIRDRVEKTVTIFAATTPSTVIHMQKEEIEDYIWLTYDRALSLLRFDNDKSILIAAHDFLDQNNII